MYNILLPAQIRVRWFPFKFFSLESETEFFRFCFASIFHFISLPKTFLFASFRFPIFFASLFFFSLQYFYFNFILFSVILFASLFFFSLRFTSVFLFSHHFAPVFKINRGCFPFISLQNIFSFCFFCFASFVSLHLAFFASFRFISLSFCM
jgi:hypothetical protein